MPDNEEERKSTAGIVTPNASKDDEWRREVGGVFTFTDADSGGNSYTSPVVSPAISACFSPINPSPQLLRVLGLA